MNILILGSGGREHALAWKINQSDKCDQLYIAPGNAGTAELGTNIALDPNDFEAVANIVTEHQIKMVIVGPEEPLVRGIYDFFKSEESLAAVRLVGPSQKGAQLEGSKAFAKQFMEERDIPTAAYAEFTADTLEEGLQYIATQTPPIVIKADGLAAGKGVLILDSVEEAQRELKIMLDGKFGEASQKVVVEEFLDGIEFSVFALTDGKSYKLLPIAKDYKRIGEGDTGPNTGGMGAVSPVPFVDEQLLRKVENWIVSPTLTGLQEIGAPYKGFLFFGLINVEGNPYVIEYNCRLGDPETQVVLPRLESDLLDLLLTLDEETLASEDIKISEQAAATVVLVSGGYPGAYEKGKTITGLERVKHSTAFLAGTTEDEHGTLRTSGGRVLALTSTADQFSTAVQQSLEGAELISFEGKYHRRDIGSDL